MRRIIVGCALACSLVGGVGFGLAQTDQAATVDGGLCASPAAGGEMATPVEVVLATPGAAPEAVGSPVTMFACASPSPVPSS